MADILIGGFAALLIIAREERRPGLAAMDRREFPRQILGILHAGIRTAGTERRNLMRGIASKDHPAMDEAFQPKAAEPIDRYPFEVEFRMPQHALDPGADPLGPFLELGIGGGRQLEIDPPDVIRLAVEQSGATGMKGRIEPEPALGRIVAPHPDIGDQELLLEDLPGKIEAEHRPNG